MPLLDNMKGVNWGVISCICFCLSSNLDVTRLQYFLPHWAGDLSVPVNLVISGCRREIEHSLHGSVSGTGSREIKDQNVSGKESGGRQSMKFY